MTDITERLRSLYVQHGTDYVQEAAEEIERLRGELSDATIKLENEKVGAEEIYQENERLRAERDRALDRIAEMSAELKGSVGARWINPNDKTQEQYLPWIGAPCLFAHEGVIYYGHHTGGSFQTGRGVTARFFPTWRSLWMPLPAAPKPEDTAATPPSVPDFADAYQGAREEVAIWKRRALEAEALNRKFMAEINGPTHMGEPVATPPSVPEITDEMVSAYLAEQAATVQAVDDMWGSGGKAPSYMHPVREACRAGLKAALLASAPKPEDV